MATWTEDGSGKLTVTGATVEYTGEAKGDAKVFLPFKVKTTFYFLPHSISLFLKLTFNGSFSVKYCMSKKSLPVYNVHRHTRHRLIWNSLFLQSLLHNSKNI